jgi:hypothetical protein
MDVTLWFFDCGGLVGWRRGGVAFGAVQAMGRIDGSVCGFGDGGVSAAAAAADYSQHAESHGGE